MTFLARPTAALAVVLLLVAGCGGGDQEPHPVDQPPPTNSRPISPGQVGLSDRAPAEQPALLPPDMVEQEKNTRRGFWTGPRPRTPFVEWTMRQTAIDPLARIGQPAVPGLIELLDEPDPQLRAEAVIALARIGPEARQALPQLVALVENDPDEAVRKNAVRALGQIGPAAASAVPVLIEQLKAEVVGPTGKEPRRSDPTDQPSSDSEPPADQR